MPARLTTAGPETVGAVVKGGGAGAVHTVGTVKGGGAGAVHTVGAVKGGGAGAVHTVGTTKRLGTAGLSMSIRMASRITITREPMRHSGKSQMAG